MILAPILAAVEIAVNKVLRHDEATLQRMAALQGKIIAVDISDWLIHYTVLPQVNGIQLSTETTAKVDCTIRGKLADLCQVFCQHGANVALFEHHIEVEGDIELAEQLRDVMRQLDIDWEACIAKVLGESLGHHVSWRLRQVAQFAKRTEKTLCRNVTDYCQLEAKQFPARIEVDQFYQQVAELRDGVERAEARLSRLNTDA